MKIDWDTPIRMSDGTILYADVFLPNLPGSYPVIMTHGVYGKGLPIERFRHRLQAYLKLLPGSDAGADLDDAFVPGSVDVAANDYRVWEVVDPTVWVPEGFICGVSLEIENYCTLRLVL